MTMDRYVGQHFRWREIEFCLDGAIKCWEQDVDSADLPEQIDSIIQDDRGKHVVCRLRSFDGARAHLLWNGSAWWQLDPQPVPIKPDLNFTNRYRLMTKDTRYYGDSLTHLFHPFDHEYRLQVRLPIVRFFFVSLFLTVYALWFWSDFSLPSLFVRLVTH